MDLIKQNKVMVFSKSYCPYCAKAKDLLKSLSIPFKAIELDIEPNGQEIQQELLSITNQKTVPNIFISTKHVGGCDKLFELHAKQNLQTL